MQWSHYWNVDDPLNTKKDLKSTQINHKYYQKYRRIVFQMEFKLVLRTNEGKRAKQAMRLNQIIQKEDLLYMKIRWKWKIKSTQVKCDLGRHQAKITTSSKWWMSKIWNYQWRRKLFKSDWKSLQQMKAKCRLQVKKRKKWLHNFAERSCLKSSKVNQVSPLCGLKLHNLRLD